MEQFPPIQLSEETLALADDITLAELLQSTAGQCWFISALVNSQRFHEHFAHNDIKEEDAIQFRMYKVNRSFKHNEKSESYKRISACVHQGKAIHAERKRSRENELDHREQREIQRRDKA